MGKMNCCAIFAGGDFFKISDNGNFKNKFVICADSGYLNAINNKIKPDLVLGDFDSYKGEICENVKKITLPTEKDDTDLIYAVKYALKNNFKNIEIYCSFGSRPDHSFCTYSALEFIKNNNAYGKAFGKDFTVEILCSEKITIKKDSRYKYFSLLSFAGNAKVSIKGAKYNLNEYTILTDFPIGVSNEIALDKAEINVLNGKVLLMRTN